MNNIPDTAASCVALLKPGAPFLLYLYYAFDNRSVAFRLAWRCSDWLRRGISRMPSTLKHFTTDLLASDIYLPLARVSGLERMGFDVSNIRLSYYRSRSCCTMRTDSRDRFGTPLEQRFSRQEIHEMMESAGLGEILFSEHAPYWCAVGFKR